MVWPGRKAGELVESPKSRQHQRVIDRTRTGPSFLQPQRTNNTGVSSQMRFVVPNEAGVKDFDVGDANETKQNKSQKPVSLPERSNHY